MGTAITPVAASCPLAGCGRSPARKRDACGYEFSVCARAGDIFVLIRVIRGCVLLWLLSLLDAAVDDQFLLAALLAGKLGGAVLARQSTANSHGVAVRLVDGQGDLAGVGAV